MATFDECMQLLLGKLSLPPPDEEDRKEIISIRVDEFSINVKEHEPGNLVMYALLEHSKEIEQGILLSILGKIRLKPIHSGPCFPMTMMCINS